MRAVHFLSPVRAVVSARIVRRQEETPHHVGKAHAFRARDLRDAYVGERERKTILRILEGMEERLTHAAESRV